MDNTVLNGLSLDDRREPFASFPIIPGLLERERADERERERTGEREREREIKVSEIFASLSGSG